MCSSVAGAHCDQLTCRSVGKYPPQYKYICVEDNPVIS